MGRIRTNTNAVNLIKEFSILVQEPQESYFGNQQPTELEIGMGKGDFLIQKAIINPNINYIGVERDSTIVWKALKKIQRSVSVPKNLLIININAEEIDKWFDSGSINKIYLNFSDPWPKKRHEKFRLSNIRFLKLFQSILKPYGIIELKTDNENLYNYSLESILNTKLFRITSTANDLYSNPKLLEGNLQTEYEKKFVAMNKPIFKIIFKSI